MKETINSDITGKKYSPSDCVRIINTKQAMLYIKNGCTLYDLYESNGSLVFLFDRNESTPYYSAWCNRELD